METHQQQQYMTQEFVGDYAVCTDLRPATSRVGRYVNAGGSLRGASAGGMAMGGQVKNGNLDRRVYCQFDARSDACQRATFGFNQVRAVSDYTFKAHQSSFRSMERATENNMRRLDSRNRALCDRLAEDFEKANGAAATPIVGTGRV